VHPATGDYQKIVDLLDEKSGSPAQYINLIPDGNIKILGVPSYQPKVLTQGATYCGYHAVKNVLLAKKFVDDPTQLNLTKLTEQSEYDRYWAEWEGNFARVKKELAQLDAMPEDKARENAVKKYQNLWQEKLGKKKERVEVKPHSSRDTSLGLLIQHFAVVSDFYHHDEETEFVGVLEPCFLPVMLDRDELSRTFICSKWPADTFKNPIQSGEISLLHFEEITTLNDQINELKSQKKGFLGVVFTKKASYTGIGHWISMALVKVEGKKIIFCFDSWNNDSELKHPTFKFIAKSFSKNWQDAFLRDYFEFALRGSSEYKTTGAFEFLKKLNRGEIEGLLRFLTQSGIGERRGYGPLGLFVKAIGNEKALGVFLDVLGEEGIQEFHKITSTIVKRFESSDREVVQKRREFLEKKFYYLVLSVIKKFCEDNTDVQKLSNEELKQMRLRLPVFTQKLKQFKSGLTEKRLGEFNQAVDTKIKSELSKLVITDVKKIRDFLKKQLEPLAKLKRKLIGLRKSLVVLKNKLITLSDRLQTLKQSLMSLKKKVRDPSVLESSYTMPSISTPDQSPGQAPLAIYALESSKTTPSISMYPPPST